MKKYYPIMLDITDRTCIVIGGGRVAYRKIAILIDYNTKITVIIPELFCEFQKLESANRINWVKKEYEAGDLKNICLVFAMTDSSQTNKEIYKEARSMGIPVNIADSPELCDFLVPSIIKQGDLTIAISTNGKSPAFARKVKEELQEKFGSQYADFLDLIGELRQKSIKEISNREKRESLYKRIINSDLLERLKNGEKAQVEQEIQMIFDQYKES